VILRQVGFALRASPNMLDSHPAHQQGSQPLARTPDFRLKIICGLSKIRNLRVQRSIFTQLAALDDFRNWLIREAA
jgi:hypothetical protein